MKTGTRGTTELNERYFVQCPYHLAQGYLESAVRRLAQSGEKSVWTLRAPIAGADLSKDVVVTFGTGIDEMHLEQPWRIQWTPESGGPYPDFDGELTVRADEDYTTAVLELRGRYMPPGGIAGAAFDVAVGSKIASATAQSLLKELAASMLVHYHRDEAAKKSAGDAN